MSLSVGVWGLRCPGCDTDGTGGARGAGRHPRTGLTSDRTGRGRDGPGWDGPVDDSRGDPTDWTRLVRVQPTSMPTALRRGPFTLLRARELGLDREVLRGHRFRRLLRGVYVAADLPDSRLLRLDAAMLLAPPGSFAVRGSAAAVWRITDDGDPDPSCPAVGLPPGSRRPRVSGVEWHANARLPAVDVVGGRRATSAATTFADLARCRSLRDAVTTGDAMCRRGLGGFWRWSQHRVCVQD